MNIEENKEELSIDKKIVCFFKKPSAVFSEFIEKPRYLWTMLIVVAIDVVYNIMQTTVSADILRKSIVDKLQGTPNMSQAIIEKSVKYATSIPVRTVSTIAVTVVGIYIAALIYKILTRIFGSRVKYKQLVAVYCLSMMSTAIGEVLKWLYMAVTGKPVGVNSLINPTALNGFLDNYDVFNLWQIVLLTIGISIVGKMSKKKSFVVVAISCVLTVIVGLLPYLKIAK
ncbi:MULTISPECIES: Yip1 family protein [Clostridium]|jgi:hypothetical protein|uniref:Yip1 family protein n=1 Tax=Clostridium lapidicellarium TaxID=3240931 RepID=A0ABV4DX01_9CLOT|nr:YIP1 family protein [Clostridiales bacterium]